MPSMSDADVPTNIRITNIRGTQFTVSWKTPQQETGKIKYGENPDNENDWHISHDDRGEAIIDDIHHVTLRYLIPETIYYFDIVSGNTIDSQNGKHYFQKTSAILDVPNESCHAVGQVFIDNENKQPAYDSIIYITIHNNTPDHQVSSTESCLLFPEKDGYWAIELGNAVNLEHDSRYVFSCENSRALIEVESGSNGSAKIITPLIDNSIGNMPSLLLSNPLV
ncbi:MAG: hypothetical protein OMM_10614, partial [Candidatus Magnetoglobus multicellularis str. Araruama]